MNDDERAAAVQTLIERYSGRAISFVGTAMGQVLQSGIALLNLLSLLFVTPVVTFYLLRDWDRMVARLRSLIPPASLGTAERLAREVGGEMRQGQGQHAQIQRQQQRRTAHQRQFGDDHEREIGAPLVARPSRRIDRQRLQQRTQRQSPENADNDVGHRVDAQHFRAQQAADEHAAEKVDGGGAALVADAGGGASAEAGGAPQSPAAASSPRGRSSMQAPIACAPSSQSSRAPAPRSSSPSARSTPTSASTIVPSRCSTKP